MRIPRCINEARGGAGAAIPRTVIGHLLRCHNPQISPPTFCLCKSGLDLLGGGLWDHQLGVASDTIRGLQVPFSDEGLVLLEPLQLEVLKG